MATMLLRLLTLVLLALALPGAGLLASRQAAADRPRIVAVGDIHGAADAFQAILRTAGVTDGRGRWNGGKTILVQTGDYLDRGEQIREVLDTLMRLEQDARRAGGRAEILLGNHEVMNLLHDLRDVSPQAYADFADSRSETKRRSAYRDYVRTIERRGGVAQSEQEWMAAHPAGFIEYTEALAPRGRYGRWLRARKVVVKEQGTIFMHAGLSSDVTGSLEDINRQALREIEAWDALRESLARVGLIEPFFTLGEILEAVGAEGSRISRAIEARQPLEDHVTEGFVRQLQGAAAIGKSSLMESEGPLWFRGLALWPEEEEPKVAAILKRYDAVRSVTAHTTLASGRITARFGARVFLIDTGMLSSYYKGGQASALEISGDTVTAIYADGPTVLVAGSK